MTELLTLLATNPAHAQHLARTLVTTPDPATRVTALRVLALATKELGHLPLNQDHTDPPAPTAPQPGRANPAASQCSPPEGDDAAPSGIGRAAGSGGLPGGGEVDSLGEVLARLDGGGPATLADVEAMLREALATAERAGLEYAAAQVRSSMVSVFAEQGETRQALAAAETVEPTLGGADAARLTANRICALARGGRLVEARRLALAVRRDPTAPPGLLMNAGLALATSGDPEAAELCLTEAALRADRSGLRHEAAMARANLAYATARRGDLPRALRLYAQAEPDLTGIRATQARLDRAETLVIAGLPGAARPVIEQALGEFVRGGCDGDVADALLLLARTELADADPERAVETAERARTAYAAQDRAGWALIADHVLLQARWAAGDRSPIFLRSAVAIADRLAAGGWTWEAADAHLIAARLALHLGRPADALLAAAATARHQGPAALRAAAWHATALARATAADHRGALAAVRAGLRVINDHAAALDSLELRAHATRLGDDLATLGLTLATAPTTRLTLEETRRATCWPTTTNPTPPTADEPSGDSQAMVTPGGPTPSSESPDGSRDGRAGSRGGRVKPGVRGVGVRGVVGELAGALGGRVFVEFMRVGEELHAVTVAGGRLRGWGLGSYAVAAHEATLLRFALRREVWDAGGGLEVGAARGWGKHAGRLGEQVLGPLRGVLGDREVVVAPAGALHGVAWAALPQVAGRAVSVVPSGAVWLAARARTPAPGGRVVVAAGPGLDHAAREVAAVARRYPGAIVREGAAASVQVVRRDLDGAALAHLAAHGRFGGVDPLLSGVRLADGHLHGHDVAGLGRPPHTVVLSACEAGRADGAEGALGLAGALLAAGTAAVIAGITPVGDAAAHDLMVALHRRLAAGEGPARALAAVPRTPDLLGFQCYGAG